MDRLPLDDCPSRAGKVLISSLASGLLTIGSHLGGALDEAASMFSDARVCGREPQGQ
ncbi:citrate synthase [Ceratobasidium sp. 394]|nr:citrate synthase [Ceratobasidium sp. 394]KAG9101663.1 citrate synthase [Ceratobasidium sp. UAMH 11750]